MATLNLSFEVEGVEVLARQFRQVGEIASDLTPVWGDVKSKFFEFESDQFQSSGGAGASGQWKPLSAAYEARKTAKYGTFALLAGANIRTERLYKSLTTDTPDTVYQPEKQSLTLGTTVPYARFVQAARPVIDLSDKQKKELGKAIKGGLMPQLRRTTLILNESNFGDLG